nr:uncharacterized protein LOC124812215 [Hydra vulgaris]
MKIIITLLIVRLLPSALGLNCYIEMCINNQTCYSPTATSMNKVCSENQICFVNAIYTRINNSSMFSTIPGVVERKCYVDEGVCSLKDIKYGPCIKSDHDIRCYQCCTSDLCNKMLPTFNGSNNIKFSIFPFVFCFVNMMF